MRGGFFAVWPVAILQHDKFADLSLDQLGAWLRLRALQEMTGEPFTRKAAARLGVPEEALNALVSVRLLDVTEDERLGIHDIDEHRPARKPSDAPERVRERVGAFRDRQRQPSPETPPITDLIQSTPLQSNAVTRYGALQGIATGAEGTKDDASDLGGAGIYYEVTTRYPNKPTLKDWCNELERQHGAQAYRSNLADEFRTNPDLSTLMSRTAARLDMESDRARAGERQAAEQAQKDSAKRRKEAETDRRRRLMDEPAKPFAELVPGVVARFAAPA
jgi:hypothetical protein